MRKLFSCVAILAVAAGAWYFVWQGIMEDKVAQVRATVDYHASMVRKHMPHGNFKADAVYATGFPFQFRVAVARPTLTQVWGDESFALSFASIELQSINPGEGRYRVHFTSPLDAIYARPGQPPERYHADAVRHPGVMLRAIGDSMRCGNLPGTADCTAEAGAPMISVAAEIPPGFTLDVTYNGNTRPVRFDYMALGVPVFVTIPHNLTNPLQVFVGMLREAGASR